MSKESKKLYQCQTQQLKHLSSKEYVALRELCHLAKNMYNVGLYSIRQHFFSTGQYLNYEQNYHQCKSNENYHCLNANVAQQTLKEVDSSFKSFFALHKLVKESNYDAQAVHIPHYLEKDSFFTLVIGQIRLKNNILEVPMSPKFKREFGRVSIVIPSNLVGKAIKEIRIKPKYNARFFEIQYVYEGERIQMKLNKNEVLAIDLGISNLATCVTNHGKTFIIDGKKLKAVNQWYNKENSRLQSIKDRQGIVTITKKQAIITKKRNNKVRDYLNKAVRLIINYCLDNGIGTLVVGSNTDFQRHSNMGKKNNQVFVNIPYGDLIKKLKALCKRCGIDFLKQEESYTSKASFLDNDELPTYVKGSNVKHLFSGKRISRGQYKSAQGIILNADVNGAYNIMRKCSLVDSDLAVLQGSGVLDTPKRIRVA